jgi:low affinity Fe/Cu permease
MSEHKHAQQITMPSEVSPTVGRFDRFAQTAADVASRAGFFAFCVALVVAWAPTIFFMRFEVSQLLINTSTTIITFLMVALLQNSQTRTELAVHHKLNAISKALADLMEKVHGDELEHDAEELRDAVGLERIESTG